MISGDSMFRIPVFEFIVIHEGTKTLLYLPKLCEIKTEPADDHVKLGVNWLKLFS